MTDQDGVPWLPKSKWMWHDGNGNGFRSINLTSLFVLCVLELWARVLFIPRAGYISPFWFLVASLQFVVLAVTAVGFAGEIRFRTVYFTWLATWFLVLLFFFVVVYANFQFDLEKKEISL